MRTCIHPSVFAPFRYFYASYNSRSLPWLSCTASCFCSHHRPHPFTASPTHSRNHVSNLNSTTVITTSNSSAKGGTSPSESSSRLQSERKSRLTMVTDTVRLYCCPPLIKRIYLTLVSSFFFLFFLWVFDGVSFFSLLLSGISSYILIRATLIRNGNLISLCSDGGASLCVLASLSLARTRLDGM